MRNLFRSFEKYNYKGNYLENYKRIELLKNWEKFLMPPLPTGFLTGNFVIFFTRKEYCRNKPCNFI